MGIFYTESLPKAMCYREEHGTDIARPIAFSWHEEAYDSYNIAATVCIGTCVFKDATIMVWMNDDSTFDAYAELTTTMVDLNAGARCWVLGRYAYIYRGGDILRGVITGTWPCDPVNSVVESPCAHKDGEQPRCLQIRLSMDWVGISR